MNNSDYDKLISSLSHLNGNSCWGFVAGQGTGSRLSLSIGSKLPLKKPINNPTLSDDLRKFLGEYELFIQCSWRLEDKHGVVCSWSYGNESNGPMMKGLQFLVGRRIINVTVGKPVLDLTLTFDGHLQFKTFCDSAPEDPAYPACDYTICDLNTRYSIAQSWVFISPRQKN